MEIRQLEPNEFHLLRFGREEGRIPDPDFTAVLGAFDNGRLVASVLLVAAPLLEEPWIDPEYRNGTLCKRLHDLAVERCERYGLPSMVAISSSLKHDDYLRRLGYKPTGTAWEKKHNVGKKENNHRTENLSHSAA